VRRPWWEEVATYNDERRIVEAVFTVDVDALVDELLALSQITMPTSLEKLLKLDGRVQGVLVSEDAVLDHAALLVELPLQLMLAEDHGGGCGTVLFTLF
jgi:hypothetical protein